MSEAKVDGTKKLDDRIVKDEFRNNKITKYLKALKENIIDMDFIKNIFNEVVKSDNQTTEINAELQSVIVETLNEATKHENLSQEMLEMIINEQIENSRSIRESKEKDDARKDEKIKMLKDWSKAGGAALVAVVLIALVKAGIDLKDVKDIFS